MASFGWKRKIGEKVSKVTSQQFEAEAADEKDVAENEEGNWLHAIKRRKEILLEGCAEKSKQLKDEGASLAENKRIAQGLWSEHHLRTSSQSTSLLNTYVLRKYAVIRKYREAIQKWDEALQLTPDDATLYEMKSQVLMSLHEMFPAVHAAEMAVQRNPHSWESWQTLGRAQLGLGEIVLAIRSFQVALHIYPMNPEIWKEDLSWARTLQEQQKVAQKIKKCEASSEGTHFSPKSIPDYDFESDEIVAVCAAIAEKQKTVPANKTMVIVSASGTVETVTEKEDGATPPDGSVFIKAR
nr:tetratricopeptide repeat protein 33 isoform X1 [Vulpes vulpes]XP_025872472.1 tetratricopeptide repeat protein 33 isoform X1 [Vulpes vulpes]XP_025872473.1 tetratricopeptide repeat protein 33 isoform X1 [Vulpes vulpes]